jgi:ubiquinone/menaquinone biosynthesis C-methylase UbiE
VDIFEHIIVYPASLLDNVHEINLSIDLASFCLLKITLPKLFRYIIFKRNFIASIDLRINQLGSQFSFIVKLLEIKRRKNISTEQHKFEGEGPKLYEQKTAGHIGRPLANIILVPLPIKNGYRILDVACGTGIVTRVVAERVGAESSIIGLDINPDMLTVARSLEPKGGARIEWHEGDAAEMPFEDGEFDLALCQNGLQFFPKKTAVLSEMCRVLKEEGHLSVCVWGSIEYNPYSLAKAEALGRQVSSELEEKERRRTPFALCDAGELRDLVEGAGFRDVEIQESELEVTWRNLDEVVSIESFPDLEKEVAEKVVRDVHEALRVYNTPNGIVIPGRFNLALARK